MSDDELMDREQWDWSRVVRRPGVKGARVVVSVAMSRVEFEAVSGAAEAMGMKLSEFIRRAALSRVEEAMKVVGP